MNRTIALLIPAVLLVAMALIAFQQFYSSDEELTPQLANSPNQTGQNNQPVQLGDLVAPPTGGEHTVAVNQNSGIQSNDNIGAETDESATETIRQPDSQSQTGQSQPGQGQASSQGQTTQTKPAQTEQSQQSQTVAGQDKPKSEDSGGAASTQQTASASSGPADSGAETKPAAITVSHKMASEKFEYQGSDMLFILTADSDFEYKTFILNSPERLVIDLLGNWSGVETVNVPSNRLISGMRNGKTERGHRIVLDLKEAPKGYETKRDGDKVTVRVY